MIELTDNEKNLVRRGSDYLQKNDIKKFYAFISGRAAPDEKGHISQFFLENGINVLDFFDTLPENMFSESDIESIAIPDSVTRIGKGAFRGCENLKNVDLGNGVKAIDAEAFAGCNRLTNIFLPDSLTILGRDVFHGDDNITIFANKRTSANRLRCKQQETAWYRDHLFAKEESEEGDA